MKDKIRCPISFGDVSILDTIVDLILIECYNKMQRLMHNMITKIESVG